jgi:hypothetical protein
MTHREPTYQNLGIQDRFMGNRAGLVVLVGSDPEESILTALEEWWAGRQ